MIVNSNTESSGGAGKVPIVSLTCDGQRYRPQTQKQKERRKINREIGNWDKQIEK